MQTALNFDVTNNEIALRGQERSDYNMSVGQSELASGQLYYNAKYPLTDITSLYSFGGVSYQNQIILLLLQQLKMHLKY